MRRVQTAVSMPSTRDPAYNPPVELPSSSASNFFEEASSGPAEEAECRRRFNRFATKPNGGEPDFLSFQDFTRLLEHYEATTPSNLVLFFYAMDRNRDGKLDFHEFFLGCTAADPQTVHILNSFTGKERAAFTFDYYDANRSGFLELDEFQKVCRDCAIVTLDEAGLRRHCFDKAMELGLMQERRGRIMDEEQSFMPPSQSQFYEFISSERLRGTSRLFRFQKSVIKAVRRPPRRPGDEDDETTEDPSDSEEDMLCFDDSDESPTALTSQDAPALLPYTDLLPAAPNNELHLDTDKGVADAPRIAAEVLKGLSHPSFKGVIPSADGSFTLATVDEICGLCNAAVQLMKDEDMVINVSPPLKVFGALHGQIWDLLSLFKWHLPPVMEGDMMYMKYLFLGDYCDRGSYSLEVLTLLLALKVLYREKVVLLRGHHENRHVNYHLGLREECVRRLGMDPGMEVYEHLNRTFEHMSLAALVIGKVLALGPGILPTSLHRLDQLKKYKKPLYLPHPLQQRPSEKAERLNEQVLSELFTPSDLLPPELGASSEREGQQLKAFCATQKLNAVVASRQIPLSGFSFDPISRMVRICSCLNYCNLERGNMAAILYIVQDEESECALVMRPKVLAAYADRKDFLSGRTANGQQNPSRWPLQERAATPGRFREQDEAGRPSMPAIHVLEDQAVATVEEGPVSLHFPVWAAPRIAPGINQVEAENAPFRSVSSRRESAD